MALNPEYALGIDISQHNGKYNPAAKHVDFVISRATIGLNKDLMFREYRDVCKDIPFMAYHYYVTSIPWKTQADNFLATTAGLNVSMLFWDYESKNNTLTPQTAADSVSAMSYLRQQTSKPVGLYADRQRTFDIYRDAPASKGFPLWFAQYYLDKTYFDSIPNIEPKYTPQFTQQVPWLIWQYASELNWGRLLGHEYGLESWSVDLNVWKGSPEHLKTYLGLFQGNEPTDTEKLALLWAAHPELHP